MRALVPVVALSLALAACAPNAAAPTTSKSAAPRASASPKASEAPSEAPSAGPSVGATNTPTVRVSAGATPPPATAAPAFGPIVAGLRADGAGRPATAMAFGAVADLEVAADGTIHVAGTARLWRFTPGGSVALVAGGKRRRVENLAGRPATAAGFTGFPALRVTLEGGAPVLLTDANRQYRLAADGTLVELFAGASDEEVWGVVPRADGAVSLVIATPDGDGRAFAWWTAKKGEAAQRTRACTAAEAALLAAAAVEGGFASTPGLHGTGIEDALLLRTTAGEAWRLSPAGGTPTKLAFGADEPTHLDGRGRFYVVSEATGRVTRLTPGAAAAPLAAKLPAGFRVMAIASAADETAYVAGSTPAGGGATQVLKLAGSAAEAIAGPLDLDLTPPDDLLLRPAGLVAQAAADLLVADAYRGQVLRLRPGVPAEALYGDPAGKAPVDGGDASAAKLDPGPLARDEAGDLYLIAGRREVWRVDEGRKLRRIYTQPDAVEDDLVDLAVAPDGTAYVRTSRLGPGAEAHGVFRIDGKDAKTEVPIGTDAPIGMAVGADGALRLVLAAAGLGEERRVRLARWTAADGLAEVDARVRRVSIYGGAALALDGPGRWWLALARGDAGAVLARFDPGTSQTFEAAGPDTDAFAGLGADDFLGEVRHPAFDPAGDLYWIDGDQLKHLPAAGR